MWLLKLSRMLLGCCAVFCCALMPCRANAAESPRRIAVIAGPKSHGPAGNGIHDYAWSARLVKVALDNSNVADNVQVQVIEEGWPTDDSVLDGVHSVMIISDGRDGDLYSEALHLASPAVLARMDQLMARGCGLVTFHFSTFAPDRDAARILNWNGGYFDWETDGQRNWYSAIRTIDDAVTIATPAHPIARGVAPFRLREEFYYNIRFADDEQGVTPILAVPTLGGRPAQGNVVAWARQRPDGGRGFGTTCGHFYDNWQNENFRRTVLNGLVWSAGVDLPETGVRSEYPDHRELTRALAGITGYQRAVLRPAAAPQPSTDSTSTTPTSSQRPIKVRIVTGHQYPGHLWKATTPALRDALAADATLQVDVTEDVESLATLTRSDADLIVFNYCNWERPGLSDAAKAGFVRYLESGGGLILIHFANGAFHFSLPNAGESDWPEYRRICRRVWDHTPGTSGHDAFGRFEVEIARPDHPVTRGLEPFETVDELYFRQQGELPITVLATARSQVTGQAEPMVFVYEYGQGRIMQTVLGHAEESLRVPAVGQLLRQAAHWLAEPAE